MGESFIFEKLFHQKKIVRADLHIKMAKIFTFKRSYFHNDFLHHTEDLASYLIVRVCCLFLLLH